MAMRTEISDEVSFDTMIELDTASVADFIECRVPQRIVAKHYLALARQSSNFYPKYTKHEKALRNLC